MKIFKGTPHPSINKVNVIENQNNFPISWLNTQAYCEYCIFLENVKGITAKPTKAMMEGTKGHTDLENKFKRDAEPATFDEMLETSQTTEIFSRELPVESARHGIRGFIDEVWMTPDEFVIIDDKPGNRAYPSSINQVFGYCLAFKDSVQEERRIVASLRERGTDNIFWSSYFTEEVEQSVLEIINRVHGLLDGTVEYIPTKNPKKCRSCRFSPRCDRKAGL